MDENLIKLIGCFDYDRMKKQCQKYDLTKVTEIDNKSEEQLKTYEMTTEEEITKGDILNITGSMFDTMLDYVDNSNNELEQLQQQNQKYKEVIDKAIKCIDYNTKYRNGADIYQFVDIESEILEPLKFILELDEENGNAYLKEFNDWLKEVE